MMIIRLILIINQKLLIHYSKAEKTKWISIFNTHRNTLAHIGTKETGLSKDEVDFLEKIHNHFFN